MQTSPKNLCCKCKNIKLYYLQMDCENAEKLSQWVILVNCLICNRFHSVGIDCKHICVFFSDYSAGFVITSLVLHTRINTGSAVKVQQKQLFYPMSCPASKYSESYPVSKNSSYWDFSQFSRMINCALSLYDHHSQILFICHICRSCLYS